MQVRPSGPAPARIMIVGEAPGEQEVLKGEPFVGSSGLELSAMLREAGIMRSECFLTNVVRIRPPGNDIEAFMPKLKRDITPQHKLVRDKMCLSPVWEGIELLRREIELVRPNIIIAFGNVSMWALTGRWGITSWRGSTLQADLELNLDYQPIVIPTYHPAAVLRQWQWRNIAIHDLRRAKAHSQSRELIRPDYSMLTRPDFTSALITLKMLKEELDELRSGTVPLAEKHTADQWLLGVDGRAIQARVRLRVLAGLLREKGAQAAMATGLWGNTRSDASSASLRTEELYKPSAPQTSHQSGKQLGQDLAAHSWALASASAKSGDLESLQRNWQDAEAGSKGIWAALEDSAKCDLRDAAKLKLSVDIETRAGHIACIGIAWSSLDAACWPLMCQERLEGYWSKDEEFELMWALREVLTHPNCQVIGQNFSYDAQYFHRWLLYVPNVWFDTMLAQHSCFSNVQKGLDFLSSMYCEYHEYWKDEGKEWDARTGEDQLWTYNCKDAVITFEVAEALAGVVSSLKLDTVNAFQQAMFWPVLKTMNRGVRVDKAKRNRFAMELTDEIAKREQWILDVLGEPVNTRSSPQMQALFYDTLGQKPIFNRKTGAITCDDEALAKIANREPLLRPLIRKIQELRSLGVFLSTFISAPLDSDGRMRCSYNIAGTETYRFSSSKNAFGSGLNLQNIPKGGDDGERELDLPNVRSLFIPDPGYTFFDIDLDSADLRIVAWEADIAEMKAMLAEGKKVYVEVMKEYYRDPTLTKASPKYGTFKSLCHGTHYLGTAKGLAERLGLLVHEIEKIQKWYFGKFPNLQRWQESIKDQVHKRRMVENIFGYRMYIFDRIDQNTYNEAVAWIPQSTVGCLINRGYKHLHDNHPEIEVLLQVHDSLAGQFLSTNSTAVDTIQSACEVTLPYADPLVIPVGLKTSTASWGDCG